MAKKTAAKTESIALPRMNIQAIQIRLVGDSPLVCHAWSKKAKQQMLDKQMKKAKPAKEAKDPWADFCESLYWLDGLPAKPTKAEVEGARFGFPTIGFKAAAVSACRNVDGIPMTLARGAFHIMGEFAEIDGTPAPREDMVRVGMGTADIRYRGEFSQWSAVLEVRYNANVLSAEQIVNLFNTAGFAVGVGEWRPEKNGNFGMFHVATENE